MIDVLFLIYLRATAFFIPFPFFDEGKHLFLKAAMALVLALTSLLVVPLNVYPPVTPLNCFGELVVGYFLEICGFLPLILLQLFGDLFDCSRGTTLGQIVDPINGAQLSYTSHLLYWSGIAFFVQAGGLPLLWRTFLTGLASLPPGTATVGMMILQSKQIFSILAGSLGAVCSFSAIFAALALLVEVGFFFIGKTIPGVSLQGEVSVVKSPCRL